MEKIKVAVVCGVFLIIYLLAWWLDRRARRDPIADQVARERLEPRE